jgi:hypothetical protein
VKESINSGEHLHRHHHHHHHQPQHHRVEIAPKWSIVYPTPPVPPPPDENDQLVRALSPKTFSSAEIFVNRHT